MAQNKLSKELKNLQTEPVPQGEAGPKSDNLYEWEGIIRGPVRSISILSICLLKCTHFIQRLHLLAEIVLIFTSCRKGLRMKAGLSDLKCGFRQNIHSNHPK
jgi:hypothetical protein